MPKLIEEQTGLHDMLRGVLSANSYRTRRSVEHWERSDIKFDWRKLRLRRGRWIWPAKHPELRTWRWDI